MKQLERFVTQVLGFVGWIIAGYWWEKRDGTACPAENTGWVPPDARLVIQVARKWVARCAHCGACCNRVHERLKPRRWIDLPWCGHPVSLEYAPVRLACDQCGRCAPELLPWADRYQRETKRFQQNIALQAASMPLSHVAAHHGIDWHTAHRAEKCALERWQATREPVALTQVGVDEKYLGRRNKFPCKFVTIVSNLQTGEPIWIGFGRGKETLAKWLKTLTDEQKAAIKLFVMDMHAPFMAAIRDDDKLAHADIVHDPFHVMKRASEAVDELRREIFFRGGPAMRALGRGKRWLFKRAWEKCTVVQRRDLRRLLGLNGKLARAYQLVELLRDALRAPTEQAMFDGLMDVLRRTERRDNKPMRKLHDCIERHFREIVALGKHRPPCGRVEALNNNWETLVRVGRGYRNLDHLLLKLRFAIANPIRTDGGVRRFLALGLPLPIGQAA